MGGLTFFLTTVAANARWDPARADISGKGYRIVLEFYLETAAAVDAKYAELTGYGYPEHCAPYDVTPSMRFAMVAGLVDISQSGAKGRIGPLDVNIAIGITEVVDDTRNTILLSGMTEAGAAAAAETAGS